jgi:hypothetical protein
MIDSALRTMESQQENQVSIFHALNEKPDTRLTVFKHEFHVHSRILQTHSEFFRTFMARAENNPHSNSQFVYDYIAQVDKDSAWGLQPVSKVEFSCSIFLESVIWSEL